MSNTVSFTIDGKEFHCLADFKNLDSFQVKSSPRPYKVTWVENENPFIRINALLAENKNNCLLIDEKILALYGKDLKAHPDQIFSAEASETFKTLDGVLAVFDKLCQRGFTKGEKLIVVGGGIIQDVGAFVAACYKRGITWIHFPTTLLAMCDSCIGGKTGINYKNAKNQIALFSSPTEVIINPFFLNTLSEEFIKSGLGEILKLFVTGGERFVSLYKEVIMNGKVKHPSDFKALIMGALSIKRAIVEEDEFEFNHRRSLNYGHTLGHAIEALSDYAIPHGIAVVMGMMIVNEISAQQQLLNHEDKTILNQLCLDILDKNMIEQVKKLSLNDMLSLLQKDKKTESQMATFVMMKKMGDTHFIKIPINEKLLNQVDESLKKVFN